MSDAGPLGNAGNSGEMQAVEIAARIDADTGPAEQKVASLGQRLIGVARSSTTALQSMGRSMGGDNFLAPITTAMGSVSGGLDLIANKSPGAYNGLGKIGAAAPAITGVGVAIAGLGAALQSMAAPLQRANAGLEVAIKNAGELKARADAAAQGKDITDAEALQAGADALTQYQGKMDAAEKSGAKFGFTMSDVGGALSKLTVQTKDPAEAMKELQFAETLASASGVNVSRAAEMIGRMHAGQFRYLRQFGIYIQNINTQHLSVAEATKRHADALQRLQDAEQNLNNVEEKIADAERKRKEAADARLQSATQAQQDAAQKVQDAQSKAEQSQQNYADTNERLTQQMADQQQQYADEVEAAARKVADAQQKLTDVQEQDAAQDADRLAAHQEAVENATQAEIDAHQRVEDVIRDQLTAGPAKTATEQVNRQQALVNAKQQEKEAQEKLNDVQNAALLTSEQQLSRADQLRDANRAITDAIDDQNKTAAKGVSVQLQVKHEQDEINNAYIASQNAQEALGKAQEDYTRKTAALAKAEAAAAVAALPTLAEKVQEAKAREAVGKAAEGEKTAQDKLNESKNIEAELQKRFQEGMDQFMAREKGLLEARQKTWAGHLAALKASIVNFFQKDLGDIGGPLMAGGMGIAGIGTILNIGKSVTGFLGNLGKAKGGAAEAGPAIAKNLAMPGAAMEESAAGAAEAAPGIIASIGGMVAAIGPILLVVAAIALVAVAGYEIVTHWKEISKDLAAGWGRIENFFKDTFNHIRDFIRDHFVTILEILVPGPGWIAFLVQHWSEIASVITGAGEAILGWFVALPGTLLDILGDAGTWLINAGADLISGMVTGIFDTAKGIFDFFVSFLPNGIRQEVQGFGDLLLDTGRDLVTGLVNGIFDYIHFMWDFWSNLPQNLWNMLVNAGEWLVNTGKNLIIGLVNGLEDAAGSLWDWISKMAERVVHDVTHPWEVLSPSRVFFRVGQNLVQGLILGLKDQEDPLGEQVSKISTIGGNFMPRLPAGVTTAGGTQFPERTAGLPGTAGVGVASQGTATVVHQHFNIGGSVIREKELFSQFRDFLVDKGNKQGGNYLGGGTKTV